MLFPLVPATVSICCFLCSVFEVEASNTYEREQRERLHSGGSLELDIARGSGSSGGGGGGGGGGGNGCSSSAGGHTRRVWWPLLSSYDSFFDVFVTAVLLLEHHWDGDEGRLVAGAGGGAVLSQVTTEAEATVLSEVTTDHGQSIQNGNTNDGQSHQDKQSDSSSMQRLLRLGTALSKTKKVLLSLLDQAGHAATAIAPGAGSGGSGRSGGRSALEEINSVDAGTPLGLMMMAAFKAAVSWSVLDQIL
jgi:hypothetical protein